MTDGKKTTPLAFKRQAPATDAGNGISSATWTLTTTDVADPVQIVAQPIYSVPIIFVPGIMGSNLMVTRAVDGLDPDEAVWLMDGAATAAMAWSTKSPAARQLRLNPATTDVFGGGEVPDELATIGSADVIRRERFWGEVGAMSYKTYLVWLEEALNGRRRLDTWRGLRGTPAFAASLTKGFTFTEVTEKDVAHAADMRFPVYACGYNWLQSNMQSARRLAKRIDHVIKANNSKSYTCDQVILITHSMGGLVARACSELIGKQGKIAGILHGVMPATGAAVAYKRVRTGTEGAAGIVIGGTAPKVTAVFANSPGALQLLPSHQYPPGWLRLGVGTGAAYKDVVKLPLTDPYSEIYAQRGKWWGLVREELINPAAIVGHAGWESYVSNINEAKSFHTALGTRYHAKTVAFFGGGRDAKNGMTWGTVRWEASAASDITTTTRSKTGHATTPMLATSAEMLAMGNAADDGEGKVKALHASRYRYDFELSAKDSAGDGTVPTASGQAPGAAGASSGVSASYDMNLDAVGHEGAYRAALAQQLSVHAILSFARTITVR